MVISSVVPDVSAKEIDPLLFVLIQLFRILENGSVSFNNLNKVCMMFFSLIRTASKFSCSVKHISTTSLTRLTFSVCIHSMTYVFVNAEPTLVKNCSGYRICAYFNTAAASLIYRGGARGCQGGHCPPKFCLAPPVAPQNFPRDVMPLH